MIKYKMDIMNELKEKGYTSYRLRKERIFGEATMTKFRRNGQLNINDLDILCRLLECQPGDLLEYVPDTDNISDQAEFFQQ